MNEACGLFRSWLDDGEGVAPDSPEGKARAEHVLACQDCREDMAGVDGQRATVRGVLAPAEDPPALAQALVARLVQAMVRAAREVEAAEGAGPASGP